MFQKTRAVLAFIVLTSVSALLLNCGSSSSRPASVLYVLSQGANNVSSYALDLNGGGLSLINSKANTCTTSPCGFPIDMLLDPSGAVAFVLNQGLSTNSIPIPPSIYSYKVNSDGSLATGSDVTTSLNAFAAGDTAVHMTRDAAGKFLFVITQGTIPPPSGCPHTAGCPTLVVFSIAPGSTGLSLASSLTLSRLPSGLSTVTFGSPAQTLLYITADQDLSVTPPLDDNTVSEYSVDSAGNVTELAGTGYSPYTTDRVPSAVVAVSPSISTQGVAGVFVYVTNATGNSINAFQVCTVQNTACSTQDVSNAKLAPVGALVPVATDPVAVIADPTGSFLFALSDTGATVSGFRINPSTGVLSTLNPATQNTGINPTAITMHKSGSFMYVSNTGGSTVSGYNVDTTSGALSAPKNITSEAQPAGLVAR